jgi:hypothetical protein
VILLISSSQVAKDYRHELCAHNFYLLLKNIKMENLPSVWSKSVAEQFRVCSLTFNMLPGQTGDCGLISAEATRLRLSRFFHFRTTQSLVYA